MAGHSHWHGIRHKKELEDKKRAKIFSKLARMIAVAAREGKDPETNPKLRMAIEQAKEFRMPKESIEKAIKRGAGEIEGERYEEFIFEALGPGNIAILIEGITDNRNRALLEIKQILNKFGGKLAQEGSLRWMFKRMGVIRISQISNVKSQNLEKEEVELRVIEAGAEDFVWRNGVLEVYTKPEELEKVKERLIQEGFKIESAQLEWVPNEEIDIDKEDKEKAQKLFEELDENDNVQEIYSNLKMDEVN